MGGPIDIKQKGCESTIRDHNFFCLSSKEFSKQWYTVKTGVLYLIVLLFILCCMFWYFLLLILDVGVADCFQMYMCVKIWKP